MESLKGDLKKFKFNCLIKEIRKLSSSYLSCALLCFVVLLAWESYHRCRVIILRDFRTGKEGAKITVVKYAQTHLSLQNIRVGVSLSSFSYPFILRITHLKLLYKLGHTHIRFMWLLPPSLTWVWLGAEVCSYQSASRKHLGVLFVCLFFGFFPSP